MITEYFWPLLNDMDLEDMCLQQDGVTSHTPNVKQATIDELWFMLEIRQKLGWTSGSLPVVAVQKKPSIHNGIECSLKGIKNFFFFLIWHEHPKSSKVEDVF